MVRFGFVGFIGLTRSAYTPNSRNVVSTTKPLELLHLDLFGPTRITSLGGKKYGLIIVDDFSRFTCVIFLAHKDEACEAFKIFLKRVQNEKSFCISTIRSAHGGEFENMLLKIFAMKMTFLIISLLLEHLNKMGLLKGRTDLYKKWPEPFF